MARVKWENHTDEELIQMVKDLADKLGRSPSKNDTNINKQIPTIGVYFKRFKTNSWNDILILANLTPNENTNNVDTKQEQIDRINKSIEELINIAEQLGRIPHYKEYNKMKQDGYHASVLCKKLFMKYNDICKKYLPQYRVTRDYDLTLDEIKNKIIEVTEKLGRTPSLTELQSSDFKIGSADLKSRTGKRYHQLLEEMGLEISQHKRLIKTEDEMLDDFYNFFKELGRVPYQYEINNNKDINCLNLYMKKFKSIKNICDLLGIDFDENYRQAGAGMILTDDNGNLCRSIIERDITNFFILNNIKFKKEINYKELIFKDRKRKTQRRFDWKIFINNKTYYVEYFGMFDNSNINPTDVVKKYNKKTKKKIKDIYKSGNIDKCIFIYKKDIYKKSLKEIFEPVFEIDLTNIEYTKKKNTTTKYHLSDEELLKRIMKFNTNDNKYITQYKALLDNNQLSLFNEAKKRYGSYNAFAKKMGLLSLRKESGYWDKEQVFNVFMYMCEKYKKIILDRNLKNYTNDSNLDGIKSGIMLLYKNYNMKIYDIKLEFYQYCLDNNFEIPKYEIQWLKRRSSESKKTENSYTSKEDRIKGRELLNKILIKNRFNLKSI